MTHIGRDKWGWLCLAVFLLGLLVAMSACGPVTQAGIDGALNTASEGRRAFHLREAQFNKEQLCSTSLEGYLSPVFTPDQRDAAVSICGGSPSVTVEDLVGLNKALRQVLSGKLEPVLPTD